MIKEKGTCRNCGKSAYIVNKTHYLCNTCNKVRLEKDAKQYYASKPKRPIPYKQIKTANRNLGRILQEGWYKRAKIKKKIDMVEGGYYKCFFSNLPLDPNIDYEWHHALGRIGALLYEYKNIFPAISKYHREYHDMDVERLMKTKWYKDFLKRIKAINHRVYNKELDRLKKAGVISMETFIDEFK